MTKKAEESHRQILKPLNSNSANETENSSPDKDETFDECIPFYHEYSDTKISQEIREQLII
ncbi:hypothetical protein BpHYR1_046341 [Brachionus plicatilis]|uniref:Uncharacterized protein n=1 Tax=Brachionus plicatilis TaxID=10195 RepID=A0A3M7PHE5_BRAPC|nr:hypothetical protein BpHYR1_046341 [Brachionus plicatilis]